MDNAAPLQAPEEPLTVAYYVTGHGLGHATRAADVVGELCRRGHSVVVVSAAPQHVFVAEAAGAPGALSFRKRLLDCGAKQADALSVDPSGSLELYHATAVEPRETLLIEEEAWLLEARVSIVVTDIVPLACAAAARAGLPCVGCSNFSWDFVYADYFVEEARSDALRRVVWQIAEDYSHADALLRLPGHTPLPAFREIVDVPLVVMAAPLRAETRASLGVAEDTGCCCTSLAATTCGSGRRLAAGRLVLRRRVDVQVGRAAAAELGARAARRLRARPRRRRRRHSR